MEANNNDFLNKPILTEDPKENTNKINKKKTDRVRRKTSSRQKMIETKNVKSTRYNNGSLHFNFQNDRNILKINQSQNDLKKTFNKSPENKKTPRKKINSKIKKINNEKKKLKRIIIKI